jgi:hypothetical protein
MRYSLSVQAFNSWKGQITESLARRYIEEFLCNKLRNEGFDFVFFEGCKDTVIALTDNEGWIDLMQHVKVQQGGIPDKLKKMFFERSINQTIGFYPCSNLTNKTIKLLQNLRCATDGFLFKTKRTGETIRRKVAFPHLIIRRLSQEEIDRSIEQSEYATQAGNRVIATSNPEEYPKTFSIVDGEIELIEVKSGKRGRIKLHQYENYANAIKNGFPLRLIHVEIVRFEENHFEIEDRLITNPEEIEYSHSEKD